MTKRTLPPEVVSLIHHVELNESGWWKKAVGQVVKGLLLRLGQPVTVAALRSAFNDEIGVQVSQENLKSQLDTLVSSGSVVVLSGSTYKLAEKAAAELRGLKAAVEQEQAVCRQRFMSDLAERCPALDASRVWDHFATELISAVRVVGANMYHLISNGQLEKEENWLPDFFDRYPDNREALREVVARFFAHDNVECRSQVLRLVTAHFFAEASQLDQRTIQAIERTKRKRQSIRIILDTNYVFSLLGLHDNPADDAVASVLDVVKACRPQVDIKFQVLPHTLDEARRTLVAQVRRIDGIRVSQLLYRVAASAPLPSIAAKFFAEAKKTPGLTPQAYFDPYINDLKSILEEKGITVLEEHPAVWNQKQLVVDDVLDEQAREGQFPEDRRKGYETILHDVVLWHVVDSRRSPQETSPLDVSCWAVTVDWRFIGFDFRRRADSPSSLPRVLHPTSLLHLMQFWVPRSEVLEAGVIDSFRLPLFFEQFDVVDENATLQILRAVSRYENVDDFSEDTLKQILANRALRVRISEPDVTPDKALDLIRDEVLTENKRIAEALRVAKVAAEDASARARAAHESASRDAERAAGAEKERVEAERLRQAEVLRAEEANVQNRELAGRLQALELVAARRDFATIWVGLPLLAAVAIVAGSWLAWGDTLQGMTLRAQVTLVSGIVCGLLAAAFYVSRAQLRRDSRLNGWWLGTVTEAVRKGALAALVLAVTALVGEQVVDTYKEFSAAPPVTVSK